MYLVRHGQTSCSVKDVLCGRCDAALTGPGQRTAEALAAAFAEHPFDALYCSPLLRARQTLAPLARLQSRPVTVLQEMAEIDFGTWDGHNSTALLRDDAAFRTWVQQPDCMRAPQGESGAVVLTRALRGIARVQAAHRVGQVLVMTHKTVLRLLLCHFTGTPTRLYRQSFAQPTGAVNVVDFLAGGRHLRIAGDISYQHGTCNPSTAGGAV